MFEQKKESPKRILRDHDIFEGVSNKEKISKDKSNKKRNGRNNKQTKNSKAKSQTPNMEKLHLDDDKIKSNYGRRKQKTREHLDKLHSSYKYNKHM